MAIWIGDPGLNLATNLKIWHAQICPALNRSSPDEKMLLEHIVLNSLDSVTVLQNPTPNHLSHIYINRMRLYKQYNFFKECDSIVEKFFRIHIRPMRRFYGAFMFSKNLQRTQICLFWSNDVENRFLKNHSLTTMKNVKKNLQLPCLYTLFKYDNLQV